jgi:hypothetical protein
MRAKFCLESLKIRYHFEDLVVDGKNIKVDRKEIGLESVDWIHLAQDRDRWRGLVNLRVP